MTDRSFISDSPLPEGFDPWVKSMRRQACGRAGCGGRLLVEACGALIRNVSCDTCSFTTIARKRRVSSKEDSDMGRPANHTECLCPGCDRPHKVRGMCATHYERWRQANRPTDIAAFIARQVPVGAREGVQRSPKPEPEAVQRPRPPIGDPGAKIGGKFLDHDHEALPNTMTVPCVELNGIRMARIGNYTTMFDRDGRVLHQEEVAQ